MQYKNILIVLGFMLLISGCKPTYTGHKDNTPYETKSCWNTLRQGNELIKSEQIDKIVVYKADRELHTYYQGSKKDTFRISLGAKGGANGGNKVQVGDYRTPEGSYDIIRKKCDSRLYKSLLISYPNRAEKARARAKGLNPGGLITIHGQPKWNADGRGDDYTLSQDWTEGCMAVTNDNMDKLWRAVENGVKIVIHP